MRLAVIDIGTNSIHMLIAEILPNFTFEVLSREKDMTRLGDGTLSSGYLSAAVMERGLNTVKKFHYLAQMKGAQKIVAVATSAVRETHNGGDFLQRILQETGIKVRVITGEEEGRLIYQGVKHSVDLPKKENTLIIDIGGGSVEIILANAHKILYLVSLKIGAARMKDLFLPKGTKKDFERLEEYVLSQLKEIAPQISELGFTQSIGTSGTINNLAAMAYLAQNPASASVIRNPVLTFEDMKKIYRDLQESSADERSQMKGLDPLRNDLILSGAAVAFLLMKSLKVETLTACDKAIREGMIYDYISHNRRKIKSETLIPDVRRRNILKLATKCHYGKDHAEHTARLAMQIFDQTSSLHGLSGADRELLEFASLLHDIGYHVSYEKHHRHAYYLIKNVSLNGFSEEEIEILAQTARYHRRSLPKKSHPEFMGLSKETRRRVEWLAAILRIADALDRSHFSVVQSVRVKLERKKSVFALTASNDSEYEIWDANRKSDLFRELTARDTTFRVERVKKPKPLGLKPVLKNEGVKKIAKAV